MPGFGSGEVGTTFYEYTPKGERFVEAWPAIRPVFLRVAELAELDSIDAARNLRAPLVDFLVWANATGRTLTDLDELFHPDEVEAFISQLDTEGKKKGYGPRLRQIGPKVTTIAPWPTRGPGTGRKRVDPPYSQDELRRLTADAYNQKTPERRRVFHTFLTVGLGVGAGSQSLGLLRGTDVSVDDRGLVVVELRKPDRLTPCRQEFATELLELAEQAGSSYLVPGKPSRQKISWHVADFRFGKTTPRLRVSRLRSTWIVHHLWLGVPLTEVMRGLGVSTPDAVRDFFPYLPRRDEDEYRSFLAGTFYWDFFP